LSEAAAAFEADESQALKVILDVWGQG